MSLSSEAVSLISALNSISEHVALENITIEQASRFAEQDVNKLSSLQEYRKTHAGGFHYFRPELCVAFFV